MITRIKLEPTINQMKTSLLLHTIRMNQLEVIAGWGDARLIRHHDGRHEVIGGTAEDQAVVREWIALFAHDIVLDQPGRRGASPEGVSPRLVT